MFELNLCYSSDPPPVGSLVGTLGATLHVLDAVNLQLVGEVDRDTYAGSLCEGWCGRAELSLEFVFGGR